MPLCAKLELLVQLVGEVLDQNGSHGNRAAVVLR
jgi:hypothetical protein